MIPGIRPKYRLSQVWRHLSGSRSCIDWALVQRELDKPLYALFSRMTPGDQAHAYCVWQHLHHSGEVPADLSHAALLHDVGKIQAALSLFQRSLFVILRAVAPGLLERLGSRYKPFALYEQHAAIGAQMARAAGCSERTAWLIANHGLKTGEGKGMIQDIELAALQAADDTC